MTKQKLEKEAEEYLAGEDYFDGFVILPSAVAEAYIKGAEPREKRIAELEAQIEEMKCCGNCAKYESGYGETPCKISASAICGEWETSIGKF